MPTETMFGNKMSIIITKQAVESHRNYTDVSLPLRLFQAWPHRNHDMNLKSERYIHKGTRS